MSESYEPIVSIKVDYEPIMIKKHIAQSITVVNVYHIVYDGKDYVLIANKEDNRPTEFILKDTNGSKVADDISDYIINLFKKNNLYED